ncbi:prenyltransferase/squalene oxidase repeat-containing protein [Streptomyces sp. NPDC088246]|uniref:prenyltransferase/squalene oxidase repeat-containing protein n=1 Tax=Streptomyces sp. NPDC088246 TaxID=3365842 RepID=UPI00381879F8
MTTSEIGTSGSGASGDLDPATEPSAAGRLTAVRESVRVGLTAVVGSDGTVRRPCASRALESALLLVLLRRCGSHPQEQRELAAYLGGPQARADAFGTAMARAALDGLSPGTDVVGSQLLAGFDHFSRVRKRLLFDVYLAVAGAAPFDESMLRPPREPDRSADAGSDSGGGDNTVTWIEMIMLSVRVVVAHGLGAGDQVTEWERGRLLELLGSSRTPVWENYPAAHLMALLAVHEFAPGHALVQSGVAAVLACRNTDGGVPSMANLDVFSTGPAGLALARAGADRGLLHRMCDYLTGQQMPDGGWAFGEHMGHSDVDASSYAAACLAAVDPARHRPALKRAGGYFRSIAGRDGGFPTYMKGDPSEVGMTAGALCALAWNGAAHGDLLANGARWLLDAQHKDGTFERSWSLSEANTIWRAMWALHSMPEPARTTLAQRIADASDASYRFLARAQNDDGGWGYRPGDPSDTTSTSYSLLALSAMNRRRQEDQVVRAGVEHLLSRQRPDGTFTALPDQVAPRPLLFDVPVFTDIWVLLALTACDTAPAE